MPFPINPNPLKEIPKGLELSRLEPILTQTKTQSDNPPLYQVILTMLRNLQAIIKILKDNINSINNIVQNLGGGGITQLTGDVTAGPGTGSVAATIPPNTVTYAKMQDVSAASRLIGRGSAAGAGDPQEITLGSGLTMTGTTLSSSGGGGGALAWTLLTNGDLIEPELVFADADVIWLNVP